MELPSRALPDLALGTVGEAEEVLGAGGLGERQDGAVDVVRVPVPLYDECGRLKVTADDPQLRARGRQQRLLDQAHQRVQHPQLLLHLVGGRRRRAAGHEDEVRRGDVERAHGRGPRVELVQQLDILHLGSENELHGLNGPTERSPPRASSFNFHVCVHRRFEDVPPTLLGRI